MFCSRGPRDSTRKWRGGAQKSSAKHLGAKKTPATFCIVSQQNRNGRRTNGLQGATQVSFAWRILHVLRSLCAICAAKTRRRYRNRWLSRGRRLAGLPSSAMRPVDRQAVPIWPLSGDSPAVFRGQTGDWRVSRHGCSNLQATYKLGERRLAHVTAHAS